MCGFSLGVFGVFTSTLRDGPAAATGASRLTVVVPLTEGSSMLVAVTITVGGAGKGVV